MSVSWLQTGLMAGLPEHLYHRGLVDGEESLSHSGMKVLLGKTPAHFRHEVDHPEQREEAKHFDLGAAVHARVLGAGATIAEIRTGESSSEHPFGDGKPYDNFRTKDAQTKRDLAYSLGLVPILAKDVARVQAMEQALRRHRLAAELLEAGSGTPEVSGFARDPDSGVLLRGRFDWWRGNEGLIVDFKTVGRLADARSFAKAVWDHGYFLQDPTYRHIAGLRGVEIDRFEFVVQETMPPFEVHVFHLDEPTIELGRHRMRKAVDLYAECVASGRWPGYPSDVSTEVGVPAWAFRELHDEPGGERVASRPALTDQTFAELDSFGAYLEGLPA